MGQCGIQTLRAHRWGPRTGPGPREGHSSGGWGRSPWGAGQSAIIQRDAVKAFTWDSRIPVRHSQKLLLLLLEGWASSEV